MKTTEFLGLNVPELADSPPDITKFSENYPKIDANAKLVSSQINNLADKVVWKALDFKTEADKPSAYPDQQTTIFVATQVWQGVGNLIIRTEKYNNNVAIQYLQPNGSLVTPIMYRLAIPNMDVWKDWVGLASTAQINSLANGNGTIPEGDNLDLYITPGTHYNIAGSANIANLPPAALANHNNSVLEIIGQTPQAITQIYYSPQNDSIYVRQYVSWQLPNWRTWKKILTDKQPDWITATLLNGWTGTLQYTKNDLGYVSVRFALIPGTLTANTSISSLPVGYRVGAYSLPIDYKITNTGVQQSGFYTNEYGGITVSTGSTISAGQLVHGQFSFYAG